MKTKTNLLAAVCLAFCCLTANARQVNCGSHSHSKDENEENQRKSKEKIELALQAIQDMLANKERISVPKLMKKTGLSRGFFYKNPTVRDTLNQAVEQQAGMIDPRREILNMAMEKQIELLNQKVAALSRENKELKRKNEKLQKALRKQDLNFIKNL